MAIRLQSVVYDDDPAWSDLYGGDSFDVDAIDKGQAPRPVAFSLRCSRSRHYRLRRTATGLYDTTAPATVRGALRGGTLVRAWQAIELHYQQPTNTTVEARLHDGTDAIFWDGTDWSVAGAGDWNTPAEVEANFADLDSGYEQIAVEWRLATADAEVTPRVFGALIAAGLLFARRSGTASRADSWLDDVVNRTLLPWMRDNVEPESSHEFVANGDTTTLDYSDRGPEKPAAILRGRKLVCKSVAAVWDLTADPDLRSPLDGAWDALAQTYTLASPIPDGHRALARLVVQPWTAWAADADLIVARLPALIAERVVERRTKMSSTDDVRHRAGGTALRIAGGRIQMYRIRVLAQASLQTEAADLSGAVQRAIGTGIRLVSAGTGMQVFVHRVPVETYASGPREGAGIRFDLVLTTREYHGAATTVPLVESAGPTVTVGPASMVRSST